ncbi:MAG: ATP-binding protein [Actinobacteria bacterium]|nr:MAG: ATP-binding protein [Actinomycetota bacterium]
MSNPFKYGPIALDESFTDRDAEVAELSADALNGQDVVIFAPRRYGKTSLVHRVAQRLATRRALVAEVNLWFTPTKEKLAGRLAREVADILGLAGKAREIARAFAGLRITPTITIDPNDGSLSFSFAAGHASQDVDDTIEHLLRMLAETAVGRKRPVVLIMDEFQEIAEIDPGLTKLLRSVFQEQPEVSHIYLGSKRHLMERIFNDANEPFWRSAKRVELGPIEPEAFRPFIVAGFRDHGRNVEDGVVDRVLAVTGGHPYATQELCYFLWAETPAKRVARDGQFDAALTKLLRSEHSHLSDLWDRATANQRLLLAALADAPGHPLSEDYRARHGLRGASTTQKAIDGLVKQEIVAKAGGFVRIAEPFYAEWIRRNG